MTGGFAGMEKIVAKDVQGLADAQLQDLLRSSLYKELIGQIPTDFILYNDSISYDMGVIKQAGISDGGVLLKKTGTARAAIFNKNSLSKAIFAKVSPDLSASMVKIVNLDKLAFAYNPKSGSGVDSGAISFSLKGAGNFVWIVDTDKMKSELLGLSKKDAGTVIASYRGISEAWVETHPFWNTSIPTNPKKVTLINTNNQ
jgi:hypothetical protein